MSFNGGREIKSGVMSFNGGRGKSGVCPLMGRYAVRLIVPLAGSIVDFHLRDSASCRSLNQVIQPPPHVLE